MSSVPEQPKAALVVLAAGAEEMEVTIVVDVLRRAGIGVTLAGLAGSDAVTCSRHVRIVPDCALADAQASYDVIVLPGGLVGSEHLAAAPSVGSLLQEQLAAGRLIGAICAAPIALAAHRIATGSTITCHPSVRDRLTDTYQVLETPVVDTPALVTSRGPGTAFLFALQLVTRLCGAEAAERVRAPLVLP